MYSFAMVRINLSTSITHKLINYIAGLSPRSSNNYPCRRTYPSGRTNVWTAGVYTRALDDVQEPQTILGYSRTYANRWNET